MEESVYNTFAPSLVERGYFPLPIAPGSKAPHRYTPSSGKFELFTGWQERPDPLTTPQPGAGIGVRLGNGIVGLDYDNEDAALRVSEALGGSHVNKAGQTAWTEFYRATFPVPSEDFTDENSELMLQVLSDGRQTVIPPSIHPDTGQPYRWTNGASLYDTPRDQLPELPADYRERIMALGYWPGGSKKKGAQTEEVSLTGSAYTRPIYDDGSPFVEINRLAMKNLTAWIPELGLKRYRRRRGMHPSYEAVPTWRPSNKGNPTEKRKFNLTISPVHGIVDFGDGRRGYSALSLVMAARGCALSDAVTWLQERVRPDRGPDVDFDAIVSPSIAPEEPKAEDTQEARGPDEAPGPDGRERVKPGKLLGHAWYFGDPVPEQPPMLVPFFVPARGFGYLGGQWGTFKTFIVNDLAVAVASGTRFAGQQVSGRGVVIQIELEGSNNEARMLAAATVRECQNEKLPIVHLKKEPPKILTNAQPNGAFREWAKQLAEFALEVAKRFDLPLALITIDPQGRVAGFRDEQSSSEGQTVSDAFDNLARLAQCTVLVVDHFGKDPTAGLRGTSAKEANPLFILNTSEQQKDVFARRHLEIRKMRNGVSGMVMDFWMEELEVQTPQIVRNDTGETSIQVTSVKTLTVRWGNKLRAASANDEGEKRSRGGTAADRALTLLGTMINEGGVELPAECDAPRGLRGVLLEAWRQRAIEAGVVGGKRPDTAFWKTRKALEERGEIAIGHGFVWVPLPGATEE